MSMRRTRDKARRRSRGIGGKIEKSRYGIMQTLHPTEHRQRRGEQSSEGRVRRLWNNCIFAVCHQLAGTAAWEGAPFFTIVRSWR